MRRKRPQALVKDRFTTEASKNRRAFKSNSNIRLHGIPAMFHVSQILYL
jgi:hypothetical protein